MARNKTQVHDGMVYAPGAEPTGPTAVALAEDILSAYHRDPDPVAWLEIVKRNDPKTFVAMMKWAVEQKDRALAALPHERVSVVSPIKPQIVDFSRK
jgi:hypothetical protein